MKIRKKVIGIFLTAALIIGTSMSALANPVDDISAALVNAGIPSSQTGNVIEYLQRKTITSAQAATAISDINQIKALTGSETNLTKLGEATQLKIEALIKNAASAIGLTATFTENENTTGKTSLAIYDGTTLLVTLNAANLGTFMTNFNTAKLNDIIAAINAAQAFSVNPNKANFTAVNGTTMKQTATNYGTMMVAGVLLVAAAALSFGFKKKTILA